MSTIVQNYPFNSTIDIIKKIVDCHSVEKEQDHIKYTLKTLTSIINLNEFLKITIDSHSFALLTKVVHKSIGIFASQAQSTTDMKTYSNVVLSPSKSVSRSKQLMLKATKFIDLTPSTKKSGVVNGPTVCYLLQQLVDSLQKLDQIKLNCNRIKESLQQIYDDLQCDDDDCPLIEDLNFENTWRQINMWKLQDVSTLVNFPLQQENIQLLFQIFQSVEIVHEFMQVIRLNTQQILALLEPESINEQDNESRDSYMMEAMTKKSNNPSSQRSLLTEVLKDSSQQSALEIDPPHEYSTQIIIRPRMKFTEYSQHEKQAHLDSDYKLSYKSARPYSKIHSKMIKSEMDYYVEGEEENEETHSLPVKRRQVRVKAAELSCSRCEIF